MTELTQAELIVNRNAKLYSACGIAMVGVPMRYQSKCTEAAAHLFSEGILDTEPRIPTGINDLESYVDFRARHSLARLQRAGVVSSGFLSFFLINFVLLPYLGRLIREWLFD